MSGIADPDTLKATPPVNCAVRITVRTCAGVIVTTSSAPYASPSGEETEAPRRSATVSLLPPSMVISAGSTPSRSMYSSKTNVSVLASMSPRGVPTSPGSVSSSSTASSAPVAPTKGRSSLASEKAPRAMSRASSPPSSSTCSAASRAVCRGVISISRASNGSDEFPSNSAPSRGTNSSPSRLPTATPESTAGPVTLLSSLKYRVPSARSSTGTNSSSSPGPSAPTSTGSPDRPANQFPDRSEYEVAGTVRFSATPSSYASSARFQAASVRFTDTSESSPGDEGTEPLSATLVPLPRTNSMPCGSNLDMSTYSSNSRVRVPSSRSRNGASTSSGGSVSAATVTAWPEPVTYQPMLPAG